MRYYTGLQALLGQKKKLLFFMLLLNGVCSVPETQSGKQFVYPCDVVFPKLLCTSYHSYEFFYEFLKIHDLGHCSPSKTDGILEPVAESLLESVGKPLCWVQDKLCFKNQTVV